MGKLTQQQRDFLRLILRSPDVGDNWRSVSRMLTPVSQTMVAENPELFETEDRDGVFHIRLSERGSVVIDYV